MNPWKRTLLATVLLSLSGCGTKPIRDVVDSACFVALGFDEHGARLARKAAQEFLADYNVSVVESGCDANIKLTKMNAVSTSARSLLFGVLAPSTTYTQMDGVLTIHVRDKVVADDSVIESRKNTTTADTIRDFVWNAVRPVIREYRRSSEPR